MKNEFDYLNDVKMDLSIYDEEILSEKEIKKMKDSMKNNKKKISVRKIGVIAACAAAVAISGTAFAGGFVDRIIQSISTGHNNFVQMEGSSIDIPEEWLGQIFDENGTPLAVLTESDVDNVYDADGNKIDWEAFLEKNGVVTVGEDADIENSTVRFASIEEAEAETSFDLKTPGYIPAGYSFARVEAFKDDNGVVSGDYRNILYTNEETGREIWFMERRIDENTAFTTGTDGSMEELDINGRKAVIMDDEDIDWETEDGVSISLMTDGDIARDEIIKMAESVQ